MDNLKSMVIAPPQNSKLNKIGVRPRKFSLLFKILELQLTRRAGYGID